MKLFASGSPGTVEKWASSILEVHIGYKVPLLAALKQSVMHKRIRSSGWIIFLDTKSPEFYSTDAESKPKAMNRTFAVARGSDRAESGLSFFGI